MFKTVLNDKQIELLDIMAQFRREYYLVGGTAIALYIGHRRSIVFDMFKKASINHRRNLDRITKSQYQHIVTRRVEEQMNLIVNDVKITFFQYPFPIDASAKFEQYFRLPPLIQLAAMKAYALGRRSKWKDYVDLFFILRDYYSINKICSVANKIYGELFSEKLFRSQLCYFDDIDYTEEVEYIIPNPPTNDEIKCKLTELALQGV
ncbi:MAG: nucleotidyl transferase AbiEii/AbiGii toxin family protein [Muribaculaceae bacterium]|nr:nucleotidyl transferase AbiEii/AbiGii toxin family protein [Muribaculaceae bacterium]